MESSIVLKSIRKTLCEEGVRGKGTKGNTMVGETGHVDR